MTAVNMATQFIVEMFMKRAAEVPFERHPYHGLLKARGMVDKKAEDWKDEYREQAMNAMCLWIGEIIGHSVTDTMNEVLTLMRLASEGDEKAKKAAKDMAGSMTFLEKVMMSFLNSVDLEHVAETLFEDGVKRAAAEAEKTQTEKPEELAPKTETKQIQNWIPTRWNPSVN